MSETTWLPRAEEGVTVIATSDAWDGMSPLEQSAVRWLRLRDLCIEVEAGMFGAWPCSESDGEYGDWCYRQTEVDASWGGYPERIPKKPENHCANCRKRTWVRQVLLWLRMRRGVALRDLRRKAKP